MEIESYVLTGGPCGGKTTILNKVIKEFGDQIITTPEVASVLLDNLFPKPGMDPAEMELWSRQFQPSVLQTQLGMEEMYRKEAERKMARLIIGDRGRRDGGGYWEQGVDDFNKTFGLNEKEENDRYAGIFHFESLAVHDPDLYEEKKATNPARYENAVQAAARDEAIKKAWASHPNWTCFPSTLSMEEKTEQFLAIIAGKLNTEIELKFRLKELPNIDLGIGVPIRQGYFDVLPGAELRIRQMGDQYFITGKSEGTDTRQECERTWDKGLFEALWPSTSPRRIEKTRYFVPYNGLTLEIDAYHGVLSGLITMECEFQTRNKMLEFALPPYIIGAVDVTHLSEYKNKKLANGYVPPWPT